MIRRVEMGGGVTTFAGDGSPGVNDGPKLGAEFNGPRDVAVDASGVVYVSDGGNHRIRRILTDGTVETLAGDGNAGFYDGPGQGAEFYGQEGIDVAPGRPHRVPRGREQRRWLGVQPRPRDHDSVTSRALESRLARGHSSRLGFGPFLQRLEAGEEVCVHLVELLV